MSDDLRPVSYSDTLAILTGLIGERVNVTFGGELPDGSLTFCAGMEGELVPGEPEYAVVPFGKLSPEHGEAPPIFYVHGGQDAGSVPCLVLPEGLFAMAATVEGVDGVMIQTGGIVVTVTCSEREG